MKHRHSLFSSACPAARALFALAVAGLAACSVSPGAESDGGDPAPSPGDTVDVAGVGNDADGPAANADTDVDGSNAEGNSALGNGNGSAQPGDPAAVTPPSGDEAGSESDGADLTSGSDLEPDDADGTPTSNTSRDTAGSDTAGSDTAPGDDPSADDGDAFEPGAEQERLATLAEGDFTTFTLGAGNIYLVDRASAVLARLPTVGGALQPISPTLELLPHRLTVDESGLYAALFLRPEHTQLWRLPLDGGGFDAGLGGVLLGEARSVTALAASAGSVVSLEARPTPSTVTRTISRTDEAAGGIVPVGSVDLLFSNAFALDESAAYVVRGAEGVSDVVRLDLASSEASSLASATPNETLRDLAAVAGSVYFASTTRVARIAGAGATGEASTLADTPAYRVIADAVDVYFLTASKAGCSSGSKLYRVPAAGGAVEHLVTETAPGCVTSLANDGDGVYWLTADGSQLRALRWH